MFWAGVAYSVDPNISNLTEAAAFIPVFVEAALGRDNWAAGFVR
jgi:hypothetical protein